MSQYGLVQRKLKGRKRPYKDVLIWRENYKFTELDDRFIAEAKRARDEVSAEKLR